jgi:hypothetical protein
VTTATNARISVRCWKQKALEFTRSNSLSSRIRKACDLGAKIHTASSVQGGETVNGIHHLQTPGGAVRAECVVVCTGGYTGRVLSPLVKNKIHPILSNSFVMRPLTDAELAAYNFKFPPLAGNKIDYSWWGPVDVSHGMMLASPVLIRRKTSGMS